MKNGVSIKYGDVALGAKEAFVPEMSQIEDFSDIYILQKNNIAFEPYGNPIEMYSVPLDNSAMVFPSDTEGKAFGIWSDVLSDDNGYFSEPLKLSFKAGELFTSSGVTLTFDEAQGIFPSEVNIAWRRGEEIIVEDVFYPTSASFFFSKKVEYYDGLDISFIKLNMPNNRLKIHSIEFGIGVIFYGDELKGVQVSQTSDPISSKIEINTCGFTLNSKRNIEFSFQSQQPLSVYFNGKLQSTSFVKTSNRVSKKVWNIQSEDYIGLMDSISYQGGIYDDALAADIILDIFNIAKIPYVLDERLLDARVSGYIPYTSCRNALIQVCFAINASVSTSASDVVNIFVTSSDISQKIPKGRVTVGQSLKSKNTITAVELTGHSYIPSDEELTAYDAEKGGVGSNVFVKFSEPLHNLSISNGNIVMSGTNYAVINASEGCVLKGKKFIHNTFTKRKNNPLVSLTDIDNVETIKNATLISKSNIDNLLDICYNYIVNSVELNLKIIDGKHTIYGNSIKYGKGLKYGEGLTYGDVGEAITEYDKPTNVGDLITVDADFLGELTGIIVKQSYSLIGGITVKNTVIK
jgi:hypothetical protein